MRFRLIKIHFLFSNLSRQKKEKNIIAKQKKNFQLFWLTQMFYHGVDLKKNFLHFTSLKSEKMQNSRDLNYELV